ncbi:hypothetical protein GGI04_004306 [Coemansia thaxteri]|uniref:Uncharacterized protein n=1 Tax=Coemansia thaxteri TaxID=2663907 RepID=A0A9W8B9K0_9FUNG|nr:hypothetical protein H4R26_004988 [Coemansia thaxteri]KAJ2000061.1 hypothetical protein GGI04_004306 [Coemansia thaxteri]KAJ2467147.1 hypothetical protein GGI02_004131 [Coemansia sp. RSA 2322]KAJ2485437.1 hypothetical protein EV174_001728 [Coemansia sp. RSA 2320]
MLKAFSKVFHKSHGEQPADTAADGQAPQKRVLERHHAVGAGRAADVSHSLTSPRRAGGEALARLAAVGPAASPSNEAGKRTSVLQRAEHHSPQPRLHLKGPAPGVDGRFLLTADNIEWHLRLIPPMKESKFDWIVRYVQEQQQNVASAAAAEPSQHQRDIESSMLMSGQLQYEHAGAGLAPSYIEQLSAAQHHHNQQQHLQQHLQQRHQQHLQHVLQGRPQQALAHVPVLPGVAESTQHSTPAANAEAISSANGQREGGSQQPTAADNDEDDNTPLAAINIGPSPRHLPALSAFQPGSLSAAHASSLEKCMTGSLHDLLPEPVSPAHGPRLSLMSSQTNMAVDLNSPEPYTVLRSHSLSNPHSAPIPESNWRTASASRSPATRDLAPQFFSANAATTRQLSFPLPASNNRPSMDAISARPDVARRPASEQLDDEGDNEPLLWRRPSRQPALDDHNMPSGGNACHGIDPAARAASDAESDAAPALRVVNQISSHESDESADERDAGDVHCGNVQASSPRAAADEDEDDNRPLVRMASNPSSKQPPVLSVDTSRLHPLGVGGNVGHNHGQSIDDDDNRPLSSILLLAHGDVDDLGSSLPLPMPRHIIDPDAVVNISDIINESVTPPLRPSFGDRPISPLISTASTHKHSLLLRSFQVATQGSETTGGAVAGGTDLAEASLSATSSAANARSAKVESMATNRTSSLSQSLRLHAADRLDSAAAPQQAQRGLSASHAFPVGIVVDESGDSEGDEGPKEARSSAGGSSSSNKRQQDTNYALAMLESVVPGGRWAMNRAHSSSALSLKSSRFAARGSTLGQQLTDELHVLRESLARSRQEHEKAERRSWQVGDLPATRRPWVCHETTMSDTALPQRLSSLQPAPSSERDAGLEAAAPDEATQVPSSWLPHAGRQQQRPVSTQQPRTSRWFGKGSSGLLSPARRNSKDNAAVPPAQPTHASSLSARINNQLGRLKMSRKNSAGT